MKKKKQISGNKDDNMSALEDLHIYRAGNETDETLESEEEEIKHVNGGIPDDDIEDDDDLDDDDERA